MISLNHDFFFLKNINIYFKNIWLNLKGLATVDTFITVKSIKHQNGQVISKDDGLKNSVLSTK